MTHVPRSTTLDINMYDKREPMDWQEVVPYHVGLNTGFSNLEIIC